MHACKPSTGDLKQENCKLKTSLNDMTKIPVSEELLYSIWNINITLNISKKSIERHSKTGKEFVHKISTVSI